MLLVPSLPFTLTCVVVLSDTGPSSHGFPPSLSIFFCVSAHAHRSYTFALLHLVLVPTLPVCYSLPSRRLSLLRMIVPCPSSPFYCMIRFGLLSTLPPLFFLVFPSAELRCCSHSHQTLRNCRPSLFFPFSRPLLSSIPMFPQLEELEIVELLLSYRIFSFFLCALPFL